MNVLSLFNGMSCASMALEIAGVPITNFYSSEIDKYANQATSAMFPDAIHLGDVRHVDATTLPQIDILCGGSPCQSFSFAGKRKGMATKDEIEILSLAHYLELKAQEYEFEGQSYLFWEFVRVLHECKPKYFLLENVIMEQKWEKVISKALGINPIRINANLVSAQNRDRLYWTNIHAQPDGFFGDLKCMIPQPKDRGILLRDIIESDVDEKYYLSDKAIDRILRYNNTESMLDNEYKSNCLNAGYSKIGRDSTYIVAMRGREAVLTPKRTDYGKKVRKDYESGKLIEQRKNIQRLEPRTDGKTNTLTSVQKDNLVLGLNNRQTKNFKSHDEKANTLLSTSYKGSQANGMTLVLGCDYRKDEGMRIRKGGKSGTLQARARNDESCGQMVIIPEATAKGYTEIMPGECFDAEHPKSKTRRGRKMVDKSNCLMAKKTDFMYYDQQYRIRRLTPSECAKLQSVPQKYIDIMLNCGISDTQLYKMYGNGWNVDVIAHIFSFINHDSN